MSFTPHLKVKHVPKCKGFDGVECKNDKPKNKKYCPDCEKLKRHADVIEKNKRDQAKRLAKLEEQKAKKQELETDIVRLNLLPEFQPNPSPKIKGWNKKGKIKKVSKKQSKVLTKKDKIRKEIWNERPHLCESCNCNGSNTTLELSHIIRISYRKDLDTDKNNITIACRECHLKIEAWELDGLLNEKEIREYVQEKDPEFYRVMEIDFHYCQRCKELSVPNQDVKFCKCGGTLQRLDKETIITDFLLNKDTKKLC